MWRLTHFISKLLPSFYDLETLETIDIKSDYRGKMRIEFYFKKERRLILREGATDSIPCFRKKRFTED